MKLKHYSESEIMDVTDYGSTGTTIRWLITKEDGAPRFAMRRFELEPGAQIGFPGHPEEHEIYILSGEGEIFTEEETITAKANDVLYVPPHEKHGYKNNSKEKFVFLCMIPYLEK